ncbi:hypothetical protein HMPREF9151_00965 [Hoylesella saccharolytica F0055]|uniref:Uncharacterized protein n=1 Tax=Hoylesella saccharolytica F0055 TaxID=1127699 RepID=L1NEY7_9BACT|nr:hypothetical protein HMPREF9151_00965 [Hoylesella saccharolytica F0055]
MDNNARALAIFSPFHLFTLSPLNVLISSSFIPQQGSREGRFKAFFLNEPLL